MRTFSALHHIVIIISIAFLTRFLLLVLLDQSGEFDHFAELFHSAGVLLRVFLKIAAAVLFLPEDLCLAHWRHLALRSARVVLILFQIADCLLEEPSSFTILSLWCYIIISRARHSSLWR